MDLQAQIQLLVNDAPQDGVTPQLMVLIAPIFLAIAQKLSHSHYYIRQTLAENWVLTTLSNRKNPTQEKKVIYAFSRLQDASLSSSVGIDPQLVAKAMPVIQILFQLVALAPVESIIFCETPGTTTNTIEVRRDQLQNLIQQQISRSHNLA
jgi:hypothetical protein